MKHKKRGRPRVLDGSRSGNMYGTALTLDDDRSGCGNGMYGVVQTALCHSSLPKNTSISFIHESKESFQPQSGSDHERNTDVVPKSSPRSQQALRDPEPPPRVKVEYGGSVRLSAASSPHRSIKTAALQQPCDGRAEDNSQRRTITLFLSMEMYCARASDEVSDLWGYHPEELLHQHMYSLVSEHDTDRLARLHRFLLDSIMDVADQQSGESSATAAGQPPSAERTTPPLFYETDPERLVAAARGASTFSDTVHIKKRSGELELYEMLVYLGGGLGADLSLSSTFSKLYVVAELRKHEYKVHVADSLSSSSTTSDFAQTQNKATTLCHAFSSSSFSSGSHPTISSSNCSSSPIIIQRPNNKPSTKHHQFSNSYLSMSGQFGTSHPLQARHGSVPSHFATNSLLNTVSLPGNKIEIPKINVAPITKKGGKLVDHRKPSALSSRSGTFYFRPIASAGTVLGNNSGVLPINVARDSNNPYSTLAYRFAPAVMATTGGGGAARPVGSPRGEGPPSYTHPTTQYFLQTSSTKLNAAASAAQVSGQQQSNLLTATTMAENDKAVGKTDSNQKAEMSIRSLLC